MEKMATDARIYVAGHRGLAGSALMRALARCGYSNVVARTHAELDLTDRSHVQEFFAREKPQYVFLAAAKVGGILANSTYPAEFLRENLAIQTNVVDAAHRNCVYRLLFLASSCVYPKDAAQPLREESLLTGPLEETNRAYAIAKIAGIEMCRAYNRQYGTSFMAVTPTNLYGPGDNDDPASAHVIPALVRKICDAKLKHQHAVSIWGTGDQRREFLHSDDLADACLFLMNLPQDELEPPLRDTQVLPMFNVGCGRDLSVRELAETIAGLVGFGGQLQFDATKPEGARRKLLDATRLREMGWQPRVSLREGLGRLVEQTLSRAVLA
jgi:GDP-L-fucose synthase